jgi:hypothetical protein
METLERQQIMQINAHKDGQNQLTTANKESPSRAAGI